jgi:Co/Zn/Cd efflux system component
MSAKCYLITGANSGLGKACAMQLAKLQHKVILLCRDRAHRLSRERNIALVAVIGLLVNGVSVFILGEQHDHSDHDEHDHPQVGQHADHNLRAAYLHVLAVALTSLLAIFALLSRKYLSLNWMDSLIGFHGVGAV